MLSVVDSEGHVYYQVPFLSQNVIHRGIPNRARESRSGPAAIVKPFVVPRRFVVKGLEGGHCCNLGMDQTLRQTGHLLQTQLML